MVNKSKAPKAEGKLKEQDELKKLRRRITELEEDHGSRNHAPGCIWIH